MHYDCIIVGGGIAGLQAAIQLGRYSEHEVLVVDSGYGRSTLCRSYHNLLGFPEGVSGDELREKGRMQAESLGIHFAKDEITEAVQEKDGFLLTGKEGAIYRAGTLLLATGLLDRFPNVEGLVPCLGCSIYVCPDCDGYEVEGKKTVVLGAGEVGASMAFTLSQRTKDITYINHDKTELSKAATERLRNLGIGYEAEAIARIQVEGDGQIRGVELESGRLLEAERGFIAFGGNEVKSDLAKQLGVERLENNHVTADPRSRMTNVPGVWCAGDLGAHAEQVSVAMGDGSLAAIWIHKMLCIKKMAPQAGH